MNEYTVIVTYKLTVKASDENTASSNVLNAINEQKVNKPTVDVYLVKEGQNEQ